MDLGDFDGDPRHNSVDWFLPILDKYMETYKFKNALKNGVSYTELECVLKYRRDAKHKQTVHRKVLRDMLSHADGTQTNTDWLLSVSCAFPLHFINVFFTHPPFFFATHNDSKSKLMLLF